MGKKARNIFVFLLVFLMIFGATLSSYADWLDDWFQQRMVSSPNYFRGQERGYVSFGSFSARTGTTGPVNLISVELPRWRGACGGIDLFMGSFSFANFEYLVQKFQRLIQAAPIVAFELALNTLSSALGGIVDRVESILDILNSLQFDECDIIRPLTIAAKHPEDFTKKFMEEFSKTQLYKGFGDLYKAILDSKKGEQVLTPPNVKSMLEGCPGEFKDLIDSRSLLNYVRRKYGYDRTFIEIVRAYVGDVILVKQSASGEQTVNVSYESGCADVSAFSEDVKQLKKATLSGNQIQCMNVTEDLVTYVLDKLMAGYNAKKSGTDIRTVDDYTSIAKISPISVETVVKYAVLTDNPSVVEGSAPVIANGVIYLILSSLMSEVALLSSRLSSYKGSCSVIEKVTDFSSALEKFEESRREFYKRVKNAYMVSLSEFSTTLDVAKDVKELEEMVNSIISSKLSRIYYGRM